MSLKRMFKLSGKKSYHLNVKPASLTELHIGADYVPVFEILNYQNLANQPSTITDKEIFFIRMSQEGLVVSHKPSINLHRDGTLELWRTYKQFRQKEALNRVDTFRPICRRSKSDRCRLIKWHLIESIELFPPKILVFTLKAYQNCEDIITNQHTCDCPHNNNNNLQLKCDNPNHCNKRICFEFLLKKDFNSFITSGVYYGMIEHTSQDSSGSTNPSNDNLQKPLSSSTGNLVSRLITTKNRMISWLTRRRTFPSLVTE